MNYAISFQERARLAMELLSNQPPVTLKEAKEQVEWLKVKSTSRKKKQMHLPKELPYS